MAGSSHTAGEAADIAVTGSRQRLALLRAIVSAKAHRMGVAESFIHVDVSTTRTPHVAWIYR